MGTETEIYSQNLIPKYQIGDAVILDMNKTTFKANISGINITPHRLTYNITVWLSGDSNHYLDFNDVNPKAILPDTNIDPTQPRSRFWFPEKIKHRIDNELISAVGELSKKG